MAATDGKLPVMTERTATVAVSLTLAAMVSSPFAAVARAEPYYAFQSPSANVYLQSRSLNELTCDSEVSGMTCTDRGSGHYFHLARDNYELH